MMNKSQNIRGKCINIRIYAIEAFFYKLY